MGCLSSTPVDENAKAKVGSGSNDMVEVPDSSPAAVGGAACSGPVATFCTQKSMKLIFCGADGDTRTLGSSDMPKATCIVLDPRHAAVMGKYVSGVKGEIAGCDVKTSVMNILLLLPSASSSPRYLTGVESYLPFAAVVKLLFQSIPNAEGLLDSNLKICRMDEFYASSASQENALKALFTGGQQFYGDVSGMLSIFKKDDALTTIDEFEDEDEAGNITKEKNVDLANRYEACAFKSRGYFTNMFGTGIEGLDEVAESLVVDFLNCSEGPATASTGLAAMLEKAVHARKSVTSDSGNMSGGTAGSDSGSSDLSLEIPHTISPTKKAPKFHYVTGSTDAEGLKDKIISDEQSYPILVVKMSDLTCDEAMNAYRSLCKGLYDPDSAPPLVPSLTTVFAANVASDFSENKFFPLALHPQVALTLFCLESELGKLESNVFGSGVSSGESVHTPNNNISSILQHSLVPFPCLRFATLVSDDGTVLGEGIRDKEILTVQLCFGDLLESSKIGNDFFACSAKAAPRTTLCFQDSNLKPVLHRQIPNQAGSTAAVIVSPVRFILSKVIVPALATMGPYGGPAPEGVTAPPGAEDGSNVLDSIRSELSDVLIQYNAYLGLDESLEWMNECRNPIQGGDDDDDI